jgi:hypothetical protein
LPIDPGYRGLVAEDCLDLVGAHRRDRLGVERSAEALLQGERAPERPPHGDLLVEQHPDEECERVLDQQPVGLCVAGDREPS